MGNSLKTPSNSDNGGARSGSDRRQLTNTGFSPERRLDIERRSGMDRRKGNRPRDGQTIERREIYRDYYEVG